MMEIKKVPAIRFKGFSDGWFEKPLSEIATMKARIGWQGLTKKEYLDSGNFYLITGTDFIDGRIDFKNCHYVNEDRYAQDINIQIKNNDVLITKDGTIGKVAYVYNLDKPATLNAGVFVIRGKDKGVSNLYLYQYLAAPYLLDFAYKQATGGTIKHLNQNVLVKFPVPISNVNEQNQLGIYFQHLDKLISFHQVKINKLTNLKKAMLEKMFPKQGADLPEIRFNGFAGAWEVKKLGDVSPIRGGFAFQSKQYCEHGIPIVKISNILPTGEVGGNFDFYPEQENDESYTLPNQSILLAMSGATTGKVSILNKQNNIKVYQNQRVGYFVNKGVVDYSFISTIVRSNLFTIKLWSVLIAGAQPNVSPKEIDSFEFSFPKDITEQRKIGVYFQKLDKTISLHQTELEKLTNLKKACLEKMFV